MRALAAWSGALLVATALLRGASAATSVDRTELVPVDEARLFVHERGADRAAPVLLWLHGGPGAAERPLFRYYDAGLEAHFVVAYWDQRGAGRSFDPAADPARLTIARHLADLDVVVDRLRRDFVRDRLVLIGHSWGGALALLYARMHPEKLTAVVAVSPMIATRAAQDAEYAFLTAEATRRDDADVRARLAAIGPPPFDDAAEVLAVERLTDAYGGLFHRRPRRLWVLVGGILGGLVSPWEVPRLIRANAVSLAAMHGELAELDLRRTVPALEVPVVFLLGRHDRHAESTLAASYFATLGAPAKRLVWFEHSAHNPPFEEPELFQTAVVAELGALAVDRRSSLR
jgi:pimeloyl-ACP methyl ester carboxylesterase